MCLGHIPSLVILTLLLLPTRIEAARRHWRTFSACRLMLAHPGLGLEEDHPCGQLDPGCLDQFTTPTRTDCGEDTCGQVAEPWTCSSTSSKQVFHLVYYPNRVFALLLVWLQRHFTEVGYLSNVKKCDISQRYYYVLLLMVFIYVCCRQVLRWASAEGSTHPVGAAIQIYSMCEYSQLLSFLERVWSLRGINPTSLEQVPADAGACPPPARLLRASRLRIRNGSHWTQIHAAQGRQIHLFSCRCDTVK